ncbi:MAG: tripartite tricarboxylate transporter permease [Ignavibacteriales bacterium]|nr:tripartite tricarboxylate transporter permease [Ignavibacteriales bacterium]
MLWAGTFVGIVDRHAARPHGHHGHGPADRPDVRHADPKYAIIILHLRLRGRHLRAAAARPILLNIPGTPANAAACAGRLPHGPARRGRPGDRLSATLVLSSGPCSACCAWPSSRRSWASSPLQFQSWEFFWLGIFGVVVCGNLTAPDRPAEGLDRGLPGPAALPGRPGGIAAYPRFAFGFDQMRGGFALIPVLVGRLRPGRGARASCARP